MKQRYAYKFVDLRPRWSNKAPDSLARYREIIHEHAVEGWRLVQIFTGARASHLSPAKFELVFEREIEAE